MRSLILVGLLVAILPGCGGAAPAPSSPGPSSTPAIAAWGNAAKLADAGPAPLTLFGAIPIAPPVRVEGLPDGTAFALWERMDPKTVASVRYSAGAWDNPVEGSGQGRLDPWLAAGLNGNATITWGENVPGEGGDFTRWTWGRRYISGQGWLVPERLQTVIGYFDPPRVIGADIGQPYLRTSVVMSDSGAAQALWNRGYSFAHNPGRFGPDVYSSRVDNGGTWSQEEPLAEESQVTPFRVSRTTTVMVFRAGALYWPQVFQSSRGWLDPGRPGMPLPTKIVAANQGFAMVSATVPDLVVRGLAASGEMGPPEVLASNAGATSSGRPSHNICGNESGVLGFVRSDSNAVVLKYRSATDRPPTFTVVSLTATGRAVTEPVVCHADAAGRVLMAWRSEQATFADRYIPGRGFEGTTAIGPAFATEPAFAEDSQGNILAAWATVTADKRIEIWWNRLRVP